jgi:hypothetical protein
MHKSKPNTDSDTTVYLCGVRVGERVRLLQELVMRDERGAPTSEVHSPGEVWTVLPPNPERQWRVLLHEPDGFPNYWPDTKTEFWSWFERVDEDVA